MTASLGLSGLFGFYLAFHCLVFKDVIKNIGVAAADPILIPGCSVNVARSGV